MEFKSSNIRMWSRLGPSGALGVASIELGKKDDSVCFLSADMSFAAGLERFKNEYANRHYNVGIAEQNLIGVAAGLASEGFIPYAVTYSSFLATRALDQVKMCLGYMKSNVKLVGLNGGVAAGILGPTHMAIEDVSAIRAIPNMLVVSPADTTEMIKAFLNVKDYKGPAYIRLTGTMNTPVVYKEDYDFQIGKAIKLVDGDEIMLIASGTMVYNALETANKLKEIGVCCAVYDCHTIKPLDPEMIDATKNYRMVVTIEEHSVIGGLGSSILESMSEKGILHHKFIRIGINDFYPHASSYKTILKNCGLDVDGLFARIKQEYEGMSK